MSWAVLTVALCAFASAFASGALFAQLALSTWARMRLRRQAKPAREAVGASGVPSIADKLIDYAERVSRALSYRACVPLSPSVRSIKVAKTKAAAFIRDHAKTAGCAQRVSVEGFIEVRFRLMCLGAAIGALAGALFSLPMTVLLGSMGVIIGNRALSHAMLELEKTRSQEAERNVSQMLEVVALGMRSGLTFDRSFGLYCEHFTSAFARDCASCLRSWSLGLTSREEALRALGESYRCDELAHALAAIVRSLRFGSSFSESLEELAAQSRANYRSSVAEKVAKAPVKMMLPTGTLILPAMLLLVLGPVVLEFVQGF